jgi:hypothetical protein
MYSLNSSYSSTPLNIYPKSIQGVSKIRYTDFKKGKNTVSAMSLCIANVTLIRFRRIRLLTGLTKYTTFVYDRTFFGLTGFVRSAGHSDNGNTMGMD